MPAYFAPPTHPTRADGIEARNRILLAALALFAEQGFAKTSTREIALAAGANIGAISYYFGDKAGLYAATFSEPLGGDVQTLIQAFQAPQLLLEDALRAFMTGYLAPLKNGEIARQCMRLHMRELIEPTKHWKTELQRDVEAPHDALAGVLCRHLGLDRPDDDIDRLAFSVAGMAIQLMVMQEVIDAVRPALLGSPAQIDAWANRLVGYAVALVDAEAARRKTSPPAAPTRRAHFPQTGQPTAHPSRKKRTGT